MKGAAGLKLLWALRLVWDSGPRWAIAILALIVVQGVIPLLALYLMKLLVDVVAAGLVSADRGVTFGQVVPLIGLAGAVALISALCQALARLVREAQAQAVTDHIHELLHAKSTEVDLAYYENSRYYDALHRAQQEASLRPSLMLNGLVRVGENGISLLAIAALLVSFHWLIAAILFAAAVPGLIIRFNYGATLYRWQRGQTPAERQARYMHALLTGDSHAKELRLFALGPLFRRRFRQVRRQLRHQRLDMVTRRAVAEFLSQASAILAIFGALAYMVYGAVQGSITLGDLVMYYQAFQRGQGFLRELLNGLTSLYEHHLFLSDLSEYLGLTGTLVEPISPRPVPCPMHTGIVFDQVSFRYPDSSRPVLQDITLTIRPWEVVALVGANGSGKTTLIKLLCRLYDPTAGMISLDGVDLRQLQTTALRREISVLFQDYARYHVSARDNIWFGNISLPPDHEQIDRAARQTGAAEVIAGLPHGDRTILGKWFENGEELSIGEWQKVALARAFVRDAQILVLDEPTSALDARAEYEVFQMFQKLVEGRTAILISHRLSTVRMADRIYVLAEGRIVESGTHEELMDHHGTYAQLFAMQAEFYH